MSKPALQVRRATPSDVDAIARVQVNSWQVAYRGQIPDDVLDGLDEQKRAARWRELLDQPEHVLHVALEGGEVLGFCSLIRSRDADANGDTGEIAALYVDPQGWRRGAGRALLGAALEAARGAAHRVVTLWVLASNANARRFYERLGFAPDGRTQVDGREGYSLVEVRYRLGL